MGFEVVPTPWAELKHRLPNRNPVLLHGKITTSQRTRRSLFHFTGKQHRAAAADSYSNHPLVYKIGPSIFFLLARWAM